MNIKNHIPKGFIFILLLLFSFWTVKAQVENKIEKGQEKSVAKKPNRFPSAKFSVSGNFCVNDTVWFTNESTEDELSSIHWDFGDGIDAAAWNNPYHIYDAAGTYKVILTLSEPSSPGIAANIDTAGQTITIKPSSSVSFTYNDLESTVVYFNTDIRIRAIHEGGPAIVSYLWQDGTKGEEFIARNTPGPFYVIATNSEGCAAKLFTDTLTLREVGSSLKIETENNIITPNNDGFNDELLIKDMANYAAPIIIIIYNVWGGKVFESNDYRDGEHFKGLDVEAGTYYFHIRSEGRQGITGFVDVIR